ncbi:MAG: TIGR01459 family HAD-type hydrolase [Candidatus Paracaedibacteraceae bacterium]|nr:TIGR01459 family HAD-type hydrolase [Candidatus Paracaedibacteraceae bacterium]
MDLKSIFDIADRYDTFLVDIWGVIYDGKNPFLEAIAALNTLKKQGKSIIFVSNNPRPSIFVKDTLKELGVAGEPHIVTSGDVMRHILQEKHPGQKVYHLGQSRNQDLLRDLNVVKTDHMEHSDFVLLSCFLEENEDELQFDADLKLMADRQMLVYCPNPDIHAKEDQSLRKTAGYFARRLEEEFGGKAIRIGKPNRIIFEYAQKIYPRACENKERMLMIGDTIGTDIKGGHDFEIETLFVQDGISGLLKESIDIKPTYSIRSLR